ncbi:type I methionyl aminopeptidase [Pseudoglutamicibacter cumminsii]|uniref:type I methionyl aminopeptidase n=1 Tax=Pseudoglutamicibacter cumminsii TaxID=156979 RepID=UPI002555493A|nr:type I methionyl aminopeptidase [Pseudoglutamicibacter cumminsii]MDZ3745169.1 type I methionyl aminopeptidase [Pseudoglutamicibacter cumminsii]
MRSVEYKKPAELKRMADAGVVLREALDETVAAVKPGVTTLELDQVFRGVLDRHGAQSNFLGYYGFPATICTSVNDEVVHGIPGERVLQDGDVLKIDGGAIVDGWHADSARTVLIGEVSPEDQRLSDITREAMWAGIAAAASARFVGQIGQAIEASVLDQGGHDLGILEDYCGHGIGSEMHMAPDVLNYAADYRGPRIKPGMALAIEPMLVTGGLDTKTLADDWTVVTTDGGRASQWEHTVLFHRGGIWVSTAEDGGAADLARYGVTPTLVQA